MVASIDSFCRFRRDDRYNDGDIPVAGHSRSNATRIPRRDGTRGRWTYPIEDVDEGKRASYEAHNQATSQWYSSNTLEGRCLLEEGAVNGTIRVSYTAI